MPINLNNTGHAHEKLADPLLAVIKSIYPVSAGAEAYAKEHVTSVTRNKGEHLVKSGEHCDQLFFVEKGILRGYVKQESKDITT